MKSRRKTSQNTAKESTARTPKERRALQAPRQRVIAIAYAAALHYRERGRDFPWRRESNPYRLAVAEILLQKTRAASVVQTYRCLLQDFPTAGILAKASVSELALRLRPLGLSLKRAQQLRAMAEAAACKGNELFDDWRAVLKDVPGLGAYASRAIASFGHGEHVGIVDANVARILCRVFAIRTRDPRAAIFQRRADQIAASANDIRATNYGLLDIAATICVKRPLCHLCPFARFCKYASSRGVSSEWCH